MKRKLVEYKIRFILAAVFLVLLVLLARVSYLQLVQTEEYRTLARNNYIRIVPIFAPRGEIFDRSGEKIVTNRPIYTVSVNDLNLEGTTYRLYINRTGADMVRMADQIAWNLVDDEEAVTYFEQISGESLADFMADNNPEAAAGDSKKLFIEEKIKERIGDQKQRLEQGERLEIAVVYKPSVVASLERQNLNSYGITMEKKSDNLSELVSLLFQENVIKDQTIYEVEFGVRQAIRANKSLRPYEPVLVAEDIPLNMVVALREKQMEFPGVVVDIQPVRDYPYSETLTHALGYVQSIKEEQYEQNKDKGYLMNDLYGQNGLEYVYEKYLRGEHGARQVEVDARSRPVRDLGMKQAVSGNDLVLTVDLDLQRAAEKALEDGANRARADGYKSARAGAAVVMDVRTGAILAMASYPSYNPGIFTGGLSTAEWQELQQSGALLNRVISATYAPGSTFKMVTATAILENNIVDPDYKMPDPGYYRLGAGVFNDWKPGGHGLVDMRKALEISCDTYFYNFGRMAGVDAIARAAKDFKLGEKTGINLPGEISGRVPTPQWKYEMVKNMLIMYNSDFAGVRELNQRIEDAQNEKRKQELQNLRDEELDKQLKKHEWDLNWQQFETVNMSIGQGDNTYTPIQLVSYVAAIANGGTVYTPYLVQKVVSSQGGVIEEFGPQARHKVDVTPENLKIIQEGMHMVTLPPAGTASGLFIGLGHSAAAKTGTAEVMDADNVKKDNHALFVVYTPYEKPEIAIAVVLEYGHSGGTYAGPIARRILDVYYANQNITTGDGQTPAGAEDNTVGENGQGNDLTGTGQDDAQNEQSIKATATVTWPGLEEPVQKVAGNLQDDERFRYYRQRNERIREDAAAQNRPDSVTPQQPPVEPQSQESQQIQEEPQTPVEPQQTSEEPQQTLEEP